MTPAWHAAEIKEFEHVEAGPGVVLLRVMATTPRRPAQSGGRPTLVADDGREVRRFAALPAPADAGGALRAAYSVPREVITPQTVFSLQLADGDVVALPQPTPGTARRSAPQPGAGEAAGGSPEPAEAERRAQEAEAALQKTRAELEELEIWRAELERRLADAATELGAAQARMRQDAAELAQLRERLAEAEGRAHPGEAATRAQGPEQPAPGSAGAVPDLEELVRRAAAQASAVAARELARALAESPPESPGTL